MAFPFTRLSARLLGDAIGSNLMMVGVAYQKGWLPLDLAAFMRAIDLNGVGVGMNKAAFAWGRQLAIEPRAVYAAAGLSDPEPESLDSKIERRAQSLGAYQDPSYADRYLQLIARVRNAEAKSSDETKLTEVVAQALYRLMAYKDEYEVARLYTDGRFAKAVKEQFDGSPRLTFHLAPPILGRRDKATGLPRKQAFRFWMMPLLRMLASMKGLRGTAFDPFGYTRERRMERALITEYETVLDRLLQGLNAENLSAALAIASLALSIRGYGHIKQRTIQSYGERLAEMLGAYGNRVPDVNRVMDEEPRKGSESHSSQHG